MPARADEQRRFWTVLVLIAAGALLVRLAVLFVLDVEPVPDGFLYSHQATSAAAGDGWFIGFTGEPDVHHPPAWTFLLSVISQLGPSSTQAHQVVAAVIGTGTVVLVGLAGRRIGGSRVGLLAAGIAAVYPGLWITEHGLLSETLLFAGIALLLLLVYRFLDRPSLARAVGLGVLCGVLGLVRSEQVGLGLFLVAPLLLLAEPVRQLGWGRRVGWLAAAGAATVLVVASWTVYNLDRFERPVVLSSGGGQALAVGNCDLVESGPLLGYWDVGCIGFMYFLGEGDRTVHDSEARAVALEWMADNPGSLPTMVLAREGRTWGLFRPVQQIDLEHECCGTRVDILWARQVMYWALLPLAALGLVALRRRSVPIWPFFAIAGVAVLATAATYGETRSRSVAEVPLVVAAGAGAGALVDRGRGRRTTRPGEPADDERLVLAGPTMVSADGAGG